MRVDSPYKSHVSVDGPDSGKIKLGNLKGNENSCLLKGQVDTHKSIGRGVRTRSMVSDTDMIVDNLNVPPVPVCLGCPKPDLISKMKPMTATEKETAEHTKTICQEIFQAKWGNHPESFRWEDLDYELQINVKEAKFLRNNWKEFVLENDLKVGDIGVFELIKENENLLEVTILSVDENGNEEDDDLFLNLFTGVSVSTKSTEKSNSPCPLPRKKMRTDSPNQPGTKSKLEILSSGISSNHSKSNRINLGNLKEVENAPRQLEAERSVKIEAFISLRHLTATEKEHAVQIANALKSTGNPVFMVFMRPSFVCNRYRMVIPSDFAREFLTMHKGNLTLCNSTGKTWTTKYYRNSGNKTQAELYSGWREFAEDNHLDIGDICVFELIKHPEMLMKMIIYASKSCRQWTHGSTANRVKTRRMVSDTKPTCQQSPCPSSSRKFKDPTDAYIEILDDSPLNQKTKKKLKSPLTPTEKQRACMGASNFRTSNPSFSVVMHTAYVNSCTHLIIPDEFADRYLKNSGEIILPDGRTWTVEYGRITTDERRKAVFGRSSWEAFVMANELKEGDVCIFQHIKDNDNLLEVVILRELEITYYNRNFVF
ncbi:B3 domain-containing protein LOC_Os12g40080-like [Hibiscus syriacus]|uniref:B3 domain-containing protein LOC_Os12g40080-like n=1 Tax=Hibiscus syriacus TaxID=106335 RepID=UPI0019231CB0|nr:B3 domain-containing protein LOC_Os12g40080-like [Hibiscus syriacus]